jgi:hypothetical protein
MRAWPLHVVFAAILVGSLAAQDRTIHLLVESSGLEAAVIGVARADSWVFRDYKTITGTDVRALRFGAPGCAPPVLVVLLRPTFDQEGVVRSAREPGYTLRYVYMDRSWDKADRLAVLAERAKYETLAVFGLTRHVPSWELLLVESPPNCQAANAIDWRPAWSRNNLAAAKATSR